jgi:hypothetical protein
MLRIGTLPAWTPEFLRKILASEKASKGSFSLREEETCPVQEFSPFEPPLPERAFLIGGFP